MNYLKFEQIKLIEWIEQIEKLIRLHYGQNLF